MFLKKIHKQLCMMFGFILILILVPPAFADQASFFTFNICGSSKSQYCVGDPLPALANFIEEYRPTAFALQEVRASQADELSRMLRDRGLDYVQRYRNLSALPFRINSEGIALFHVGNTLGEIREGVFNTLSCADYLHREFPFCPLQPRGYVCVKVPQANFWACATHIEVKEHVQKAQIDELAQIAEKLNAPDLDGNRVPVVVGGDFNVPPIPEKDGETVWDSPLNAMLDKETYIAGTGSFFEHDLSAYRIFDKPAATHGEKKIDYIFHSVNVYVETSAVFEPGASDHRLLFNEFYISSVPIY